jgi:hypothetical protein
MDRPNQLSSRAETTYSSLSLIYPTRTWGPKEKSNLRHHLSREASDQAAHQDGATVMRERGEGDGG